MSERAKEIAEKIIAEVWPDFVCNGTRKAIEAAVEKYMMRPHQVRDRDGDVWEQMSNGKYSQPKLANGYGYIMSYGPLTEVQGEPLPDPKEAAALKERIAELEKQLAEANSKIAITTGIGATLGEAKSQDIWQLASEGEWVFGAPIRGAVRETKAIVQKCRNGWIWGTNEVNPVDIKISRIAAIDAAEKAMGVK